MVESNGVLMANSIDGILRSTDDGATWETVISEAGAGDIFAIFGVDCASGETFCDQGINVTMQDMHVPEPVMSLTIKPKKAEQLEAFLKALNRFQREDPTFLVKQNMAGASLSTARAGASEYDDGSRRSASASHSLARSRLPSLASAIASQAAV